MNFLELFDKKAEERNWVNFFLILLKFLSKEELKWKPDADDKTLDTYRAIFPEKGINGGLEAKISTIKINDIYCTISIGHHEEINVMLIDCLMEEDKTSLRIYYRCDNLKVVIIGKENKLVKSRFKNLHDKLIRLRLNNRT